MDLSRRVFVRDLLIASAYLGLGGCASDKSAGKLKKVKVGALFPLTGSLRDKGVDSANGVRLAAAEINAAGGIKNLGGAKLEIVYADTKGSPEEGARAALRLIKQDHVAAIIGTYQSSVTKPATKVAEHYKTPFIVSISIANIITERGFQYTFRVQPKARYYARDQARFLKGLEKTAAYKVRRVALLHENTDFGTSAALAQKHAVREAGMTVVAEVGYRAEGVKNLDTEIAAVLAAEPDAVITVTYLDDSILIRQGLNKTGSKALMLDTAGGTVSPEFVKKLGSAAEGTFTVAEFTKFAAGGRELNNRYRARYKVDITGDSAHAYQAVLVLKDALERAKTTDKEKLRNALAATDLKHGAGLVLPAERLKFDARGQNRFARLFVVQIQKGELVPVWPPEYATAKVVISK